MYIHQVRKSLDFLKTGVLEISKMSKTHSSPVVKIVPIDTPKEVSEIVPKETYAKILNSVRNMLEESDSFMSLTEIVKKVYQRGLRPQVTPEKFVGTVLQAIKEVDSESPLETEPDIEGIRYRRSNVQNRLAKAI